MPPKGMPSEKGQHIGKRVVTAEAISRHAMERRYTATRGLSQRLQMDGVMRAPVYVSNKAMTTKTAIGDALRGPLHDSKDNEMGNNQ